MSLSPASISRMMGCLAAVLFLTGCVCAVPMPVSSKVEHGRQLKRADVAFIQRGVTTRSEVIQKLGSDYIALPQRRAIAYSWEMKGGGGVWWYCIVAGCAGAANGGSWVGGWRAYFIAFDDQGIVTRVEFKKPSTRISLHEHLYAWDGGYRPPKPRVQYAQPLFMSH